MRVPTCCRATNDSTLIRPRIAFRTRLGVSANTNLKQPTCCAAERDSTLRIPGNTSLVVNKGAPCKSLPSIEMVRVLLRAESSLSRRVQSVAVYHEPGCRTAHYTARSRPKPAWPLTTSRITASILAAFCALSVGFVSKSMNARIIGRLVRDRPSGRPIISCAPRSRSF